MNENRRIFIGGVSCSGKSFLARRLENEKQLAYINFDKLFKYTPENINGGDIKFLENLPDNNFVVDAIPFSCEVGDNNFKYDNFFNYYKEKPSTIIFACCTSSTEYLKRTQIKVTAGEFKLPYGMIFMYYNFYKCYYEIINLFDELSPLYYDSYTNTYITKSALLDKISWIKPLRTFI